MAPQLPFSWLVDESGEEGTILDKAVRWLKEQKADSPVVLRRSPNVAQNAGPSMTDGGGGGPHRESTTRNAGATRAGSTVRGGRESVATSGVGGAEPSRAAKWGTKLFNLARQLVTTAASGGDDEDDEVELDKARRDPRGCPSLSCLLCNEDLQ